MEGIVLGFNTGKSNWEVGAGLSEIGFSKKKKGALLSVLQGRILWIPWYRNPTLFRSR